ncbi:MAG: C40 family peptidase [Pseudomonadota bacterium]|nr:C40 family peptidase [Pseudomonadota bacterium]
MRIALSALCRRPARAIASALLLLAATGAACAAPDEAIDPIQKLLAGKSLVATTAAASAPTDTTEHPDGVAAPALLHQVRDRAAEAVVSALNYIGVPYRRGGNSAETGFDCSGFTRYVFENSLGLVLPRQAAQQATASSFVAVKRENLQPGDLVFFNTMRRTFSHVGIYIGDNRFIHAPSRGKDVRTDDLGFAYWAKRFTGARRADVLAQPLSGIATAATEPQSQ